MKPIAYLTFPGTCKDALAFYADVFGGEIDMMMSAAEMPGYDAPAGKEDWVAHASVKLGEGEVFASDDFQGDSPAMARCSMMMSPQTAAEAKRIFEALADGGQVRMPLTSMFWTAAFGTLTDKFGIQWMISSVEEPAN